MLVPVLIALAAPVQSVDSWPQFRGPNGDGTAPGARPPITWSETKNVKWKTPLHGKGWSSPVVFGNLIWMTTAPPDGKTRSVICVDRETGKVRLDKVLFEDPSPEPLGNDVNGYSSPTPYVEAGRVFVTFGSAGTACISTRTLQTLWTRTDLKCRHYRGPSSSIVPYGNTVILTFDGADQQYLIALEKATGKTVWRTDRTADWQDIGPDGKVTAEGDFRKAHSTPTITTVNGQPVMLSAGAKAMYAYDPRTGKELWKLGHRGFSASMRPATAFGLGFMSQSYGNADLVAVKLDGASGELSESNVAWRYRRNVPSKPSPLIVDGLMYLIADSGVFTCLDAKTGEELFKERLAGSFSASPLYADGRIYLFNEMGAAYVVKPGRKLEVIGENTLADGCMASAAAIGKSLFVRTKTALYCIEAN